MISIELYLKLKKLAETKTISDKEDFEGIYEYVGSNIDDAFERGLGEGEIFLARELCQELKIEYKE